MQRLRRLHPHRPAGRIPDADDNHQAGEDEGGARTQQQAVPLQRRAVAPRVQLGLGQVEVDKQRGHGDDEQQKQPLAEQAGEHGAVRRPVHLVQGNLAPPLLRAEPEGAQQAEEDVEQEEAHADAAVA